jgi:hypothetical protein
MPSGRLCLLLGNCVVGYSQPHDLFRLRSLLDAAAEWFIRWTAVVITYQMILQDSERLGNLLGASTIANKNTKKKQTGLLR